MPTLFKVLGWLLLVPGGLFLLLSPVPTLDENNMSATFGLIFMGGLLAGPGGLLLRAGIRRQREADLQDQMVGFVRSHEAFTIEEFAAHLGKTPAEAEALLHRDIARYQLPLIMHRASRRYMRLDRLSRAAQVAERCQACGGQLDRQVLFEGEQLNCPYCGTLVVTYQQAHYQQANYQPQQFQQPPPNQNYGGPWGHG